MLGVPPVSSDRQSRADNKQLDGSGSPAREALIGPELRSFRTDGNACRDTLTAHRPGGSLANSTIRLPPFEGFRSFLSPQASPVKQREVQQRSPNIRRKSASHGDPRREAHRFPAGAGPVAKQSTRECGFPLIPAQAVLYSRATRQGVTRGCLATGEGFPRVRRMSTGIQTASSEPPLASACVSTSSARAAGRLQLLDHAAT